MVGRHHGGGRGGVLTGWRRVLAVLALGVALGNTPAWGDSDASLVYYNARLALRDGDPISTLRLWLLRNAHAAHSGVVSPHDGDFHSLTWAALGELGLCQDGLPHDDSGAGIWPVALHNQVVRTMGRPGRPPSSRPFDALEVGRQQRFVSISDVLGSQELETVRFRRGRCFGPWLAQVKAGEKPRASRRDRDVAARVLRDLLEESLDTMQTDRVQGASVVAARLFDLDLQLTALAAREARDAARRRARRGRSAGLGAPSIEDLRERASTTTLHPDSAAARVLRACPHWSQAEWQALLPDRRRVLFDQATTHRHDLDLDEDALSTVALGLLDASIEAGDGEAAEAWTARLFALSPTDPSAQTLVWQGDRGARLLGLGRDAGFDERAVIALHRGVAQVEAGALDDALRSLAFALQQAESSRSSDRVAELSRRWLAYISGRYALSHELVVTLSELVPKRDYSVILEDLLWRAALRADGASFDRGLATSSGRGAMVRRMVLLKPLAHGDRDAFLRATEAGLAASPSETLRFLTHFIEALEREDAQLRTDHLPTLAGLRVPLQTLAEDDQARRSRSAKALLDRIQATEEGLGGLRAEASPEDRARALSPDGEVFAGSVRLAPVDPLPWPFQVVTPAPPSVFAPVKLSPIEWRDEAGTLVLGWRLSG